MNAASETTFNNGNDARVACMWVVEANGSLVDVGNAAGCKRCGRTMHHHNGDASIRVSSALCSGRQMTTSMDSTKTPPTQRTIPTKVLLAILTESVQGFYERTAVEKMGMTDKRWSELPILVDLADDDTSLLWRPIQEVHTKSIAWCVVCCFCSTWVRGRVRGILSVQESSHVWCWCVVKLFRFLLFAIVA